MRLSLDSAKAALHAANLLIAREHPPTASSVRLQLRNGVTLTIATTTEVTARGRKATHVMDVLRMSAVPGVIIDAAYEELGRNYRFFATWRHLAFAAGVGLSVAVLKFGLDSATTVPAFKYAAIGNAITQFVLIWLDFRTMELVQRASDAAASLEGTGGFTFCQP